MNRSERFEWMFEHARENLGDSELLEYIVNDWFGSGSVAMEQCLQDACECECGISLPWEEEEE